MKFLESFFTFVTLIFLTSPGANGQACTTGQTYSTGSSTFCRNSCTVTCGYYLNEIHCPDLTCVPGCYCSQGSRFNTQTNTCVLEKSCKPKQCPADMALYTTCTDGVNLCTDSCEYINKEKNCTELDQNYCIRGCLCSDGVFQDSIGKCVAFDECCSGNRYYVDALDSPCKAPCDDDCTQTESCSNSTCESGCYCIDGYKVDPNSGECIPEAHCCPENMQYIAETESNCKRPCDDDCTQTECLTEGCVSGCYCIDGYKVDPNSGECIPEAHCCPVNMQYIAETESNCKRPCDDDCTQTECLTEGCVSGCYCIDGYKVDPNSGECIPEAHCCPENMQYIAETESNCKRPCDDDCTQTECLTEGCVSGCYCIDGYYDSSGVCVEQCPTTTTTTSTSTTTTTTPKPSTGQTAGQSLSLFRIILQLLFNLVRINVG